jgi:hypothetical protein
MRMTDPLTIQRFQDLADAYGGAVARWPECYRSAGSQLATTAEGAAILAKASALDAHLDTWRVPAPSSDLSARVVTRAPAARRVAGRVRWWWSGVGIAATLAGAVAGTAAVAMVVPVEVVSSSTSFGDVAGSDG